MGCEQIRVKSVGYNRRRGLAVIQQDASIAGVIPIRIIFIVDVYMADIRYTHILPAYIPQISAYSRY